jgi:hypothetical protein
MIEKLMVKVQDASSGDYPQEVVRYAEAGPIGDFIALVSGLTAGILCFTNFFGGWVGYHTPYGLLMLLTSAAIAAFSAAMLAARFAFNRVPTFRSPTWAYYLGGSAIVILSMTALVFGWKGAALSPVLFFTFMNGVVMFIAGMVSN